MCWRVITKVHNREVALSPKRTREVCMLQTNMLVCMQYSQATKEKCWHVLAALMSLVVEVNRSTLTASD